MTDNKERADNFARRWYSRKACGMDEGTLADMLKMELDRAEVETIQEQRERMIATVSGLMGWGTRR